MKRALIQIPFCLGVLLFYPFTVGFSAMAIRPSTWRQMTTQGVFAMVWMLAAAFGITALLCSVIIPPGDLAHWRWLRNTVLSGLVIGCLISLGTVSAWFFSPDTIPCDREFILFVTVIFIAPVALAVWNLIAILKQPNKAPATVGIVNKQD